MQLGQTVALANIWLDTLLGVPWVGTQIGIQLHDGDPGTGSTNVFAGATMQAASYNQAASGSIALSSGLSYAITAAGTINFVSAWSALSGGICLGTGIMLVPMTVAIGDVFVLGSCPIGFDPTKLAAA